MPLVFATVTQSSANSLTMRYISLGHMFKVAFFFILFIATFESNAMEFKVTSYNETHMRIVESGFEEFVANFKRSDIKEKESLLFCLERYVDPYYESKINYETQLYAWLSELLNSREPVKVKEHTLEVLMWDSSRDMHLCHITNSGNLECSED